MSAAGERSLNLTNVETTEPHVMVDDHAVINEETNETEQREEVRLYSLRLGAGIVLSLSLR